MNDKIFIATTGNGLARAESGLNEDWSVEFLLEGQDVRCLAADPHNSNVVYAGTQGQGVLRSDDRGLTWRSAGLPGMVVKSIAISPHHLDTVFAGTKPLALYVSRDVGQSWEELEGFQRIPFSWWWFSPAESPFNAYVQAVTLSPSDSDVILAGVEFGAVVRSEDGGKTWSGHRKGALRDCHSLNFHPTNGDWVYEGGAGLGSSVAVSQDGGVTWRQPNAGLDRRYGWAVAADPARPEVWYVSASLHPSLLGPWEPPAHIDGQANAFIFRSSGGAPWQKLGGGLPQPLDYMAYALLTHPSAPGHVYAGLSNGDVWHSNNYGDNWRKLAFNLGGIHRTMIIL